MIGDLVKSTLGPKGMVSSTNDCYTPCAMVLHCYGMKCELFFCHVSQCVMCISDVAIEIVWGLVLSWYDIHYSERYSIAFTLCSLLIWLSAGA